MVFKNVNLVEELQRETQKITAEEALEQANTVIQNEFQLERDIQRRIMGRTTGSLLFPTNSLDQAKIISKKAVKNICIDYRLRCLDSKYYRGDIPYEAISKIKKAEKEAGQKFKEFKIIAMASKFKLLDSTKDPVLLAELSDDHYYFIHKWGKDMSPLQKIVSYPFRNIRTLGTTASLVGLLIAILIPMNWLPTLYSDTIPLTYLGKTFMWFISSSFIFTFSLIFGIVSTNDFSENTWDDKFFN